MSKIDSLIEESFPELFIKPDTLYLDNLDRYIMLIEGGPHAGVYVRANREVGFLGELVQVIYLEEDAFSPLGSIMCSVLYNKKDLKSNARLAIDSSTLELPACALASNGIYVPLAKSRMRSCGIRPNLAGGFNPVAKINSGPWMNIDQKVWNCNDNTSRAGFMDFVYREFTLSGLDIA